MGYCENCGKDISYFNSYNVEDVGGYKLRVCRQCKNNIYDKQISEDFIHPEENFNLKPKNKNIKKTPLGVNLIIFWNIIQLISGTTLLLSFIRLLTQSNIRSYDPYYSSLLGSNIFSYMTQNMYDFQVFFMSIQIFILIIMLFTTIGLKKGFKWSWNAEFFLAIIYGIFFGFFSLIIGILIIIYLIQPGVKKHFGKIV